MITVVRSANIHQDADLDAAYEWAAKVAMYLNENFEAYGGSIQAQRNVGGPLYQVHWIGTVESLAQLEETDQRVQADEGYGSLLEEAHEQSFFERSSAVDHIYQSIP